MPDYQITGKRAHEWVESIHIPFKDKRIFKSFVGTFCISIPDKGRQYVMIRSFDLFNEEVYNSLDFGKYRPVSMLITPVMNETGGEAMLEDVKNNCPEYIGLI